MHVCVCLCVCVFQRTVTHVYVFVCMCFTLTERDKETGSHFDLCEDTGRSNSYRWNFLTSPGLIDARILLSEF